MVRVCVLQSDNRPKLNYLLLSQKVNKKCCNLLDYTYSFILINNNEYKNMHPATKKIHIINNFLNNFELSKKFDILVFLDSDAWIQNSNALNDIINNLIKNHNKHGCFSRDPYINYNTFINSGSFILKINNYTIKMYKDIINNLNHDLKYRNSWPYDQYYISKYIFENKENFNIFIPEILNTPDGKVLRHNWWKNKKMYNDLNYLISLDPEIIKKEKTIDFHNYFDKNCFPNL